MTQSGDAVDTGRAERAKSEKCSCSLLSFVDSGAYHIICSHGLKRKRGQ